MSKIKSALLASLLFFSTALPGATYANVEGTVESENPTVQIPQTTTNQTTSSVENTVEQQDTVTAEKEATSSSTEVQPEQSNSPTPAQPEATTPEKPAITEEQDASESTEQSTADTEQNNTTEQPAKAQQAGSHLTVKQKLADVPNSFWAKNEVMQLVEMGVIGGYPDAEFRPNLNINRGQAANLLKAH